MQLSLKMSSISSPGGRKPNSSLVWRFMSKEKDHNKCKLCGHQYTISGSTSNMLNHVKTYHKAEYNAEVEKMSAKRPPVTNSSPVNLSIKTKKSNDKSRSVVRDLVRWETDHVKCRFCDFKLNSLSGMLRHIQENHGLEYNEAKKKNEFTCIYNYI